MAWGAGSVRAQGGIIFPEEPLEEKPGDKPAGSVVEADHFGQVPAGALIVPGAEFAAVQPYAREKFPGEDESCVGQPAKQRGTVSKQTADWREEGGHAIDGKHPDRSYAGQFKVAFPKSVKGREGDFKKPPQQAAVDEVVQKFFHRDSVACFLQIYTSLGSDSLRPGYTVQFFLRQNRHWEGKGRSHELP